MVSTIFYVRLHNTRRVSSGNPFHELQVAALFLPQGKTELRFKKAHQIRTWNITSVKLVMFHVRNEDKNQQQMCGTYLCNYFLKCMACCKQTVTHTFKTELASCWYRWQVWRRLNYQLMQVITRVPTLTSENASEFSSSPNYNSWRQIILRVAKRIRLKELKNDYPKEDGYKKTQHCITLLFFTLKCKESNELEARKAELVDLVDWILENEQYLSLKRREPHV